jgi:hypothetical protein
MLPPYEAGRMARERGCWRILCVATAIERSEWERGFDDMDRELKRKDATNGQEETQSQEARRIHSV